MKKLSKNNKAVKMLQFFVISKYREINEHKIRQTIMSSELSYEEILINETQKSLVIQKRKRGLKRKNQETAIEDGDPRNVETIFYSLLNFKGFIRYINYQGLTREDIRQFYPKESYIFRKFQKSDRLFGIIKGKVSIRESDCKDYSQKKNSTSQTFTESNGKCSDNGDQETNVNTSDHYNDYDNYSNYSLSNFVSCINDEDIKSNNKKNKEDNCTDFMKLVNNFEEEKVVISSGMCFGDWGVLYNIPRTASAFCLENTHTFYLEKEHFGQILAKKFARSDLNKINFLFTKIPFLKTQGYFKRILTKISPIFFDKDQIVYTEFRKANEFFLIYEGECSLKLLPNAKSEEEIMLKKNQMIHLLTVDKGGIIGLECCNENSNYDNTVIVNRDCTVLLKIQMNYIQEKCKGVMSFLQPLFDKQKIIIMKEREKHLKENIPSFLQNKTEPETIQIHHKNNTLTLSQTPLLINIKSILTNTLCSSNTKKHKKTNVNQSRIQTYFNGIIRKTINSKQLMEIKLLGTNIGDNINTNRNKQRKRNLINQKMNKFILKKNKKIKERNETHDITFHNIQHCFSLSLHQQTHSINSTANRTIVLNRSNKNKTGSDAAVSKERFSYNDNRKGSQKRVIFFNSGKYELPLLTELF